MRGQQSNPCWDDTLLFPNNPAMVNRKLYRSSIPEGEHDALLRVDRSMVDQDAEHHRIEFGDQIRLS